MKDDPWVLAYVNISGVWATQKVIPFGGVTAVTSPRARRTVRSYAKHHLKCRKIPKIKEGLF